MRLVQILLSGGVLAPLFVIIFFLFTPQTEAWQHIVKYKLTDYITNSVYLLVATLFVSFVFGVVSAYLTSIYKFFGSKILEWALILPLAFPAYILAYLYAGILGAGGGFNHFLMDTFNLSYASTSFFDILSFQGAVFVMFCSFYPYVYLSVKASLKQQSSSILEIARISKMSEFGIFFKVFLPILRPAIVVGLGFVAMESMSDFGVVDYCGVETMVVGIFRSWEGMGDLQAASKLSAILMFAVLAIFYFEGWQRNKIRYSSANHKPIQAKKLGVLTGILAFLFCLFPLFSGFLVPMFFLIKGFFLSLEIIDARFLKAFFNTAYLSSISSVLIVVFALVLAYFLRINPNFLSKTSVNVSRLGYAVSGAIVAVGILVVLGFVDRTYAQVFSSDKLLFSGTVVGLVYGYCVRFLAVGLSNVQNGLDKISPNYVEASKIMGYGKLWTFLKVDLPLLKPTIGISFIIVLIEILKELPLTLILRPFNHETLSTLTYSLSFQEMLIESSVPSISIVLLALIPVILLIKTTLR